ncbi:MAG: phenylacetate--CoA ligase family protein [Candidatus Thorarchaeota archaeon]
MSIYDYRWSAPHQNDRAEKNLIIFIKKYLAKYNPYYKELFELKQIDVTKFKSSEDIQSIPITNKQDHVSDPLKFIMKPYMPDWWECNFPTEPLTNLDLFKYRLRTLNKTYFREIFSKDGMTNDEKLIAEASIDWLPAHFHNTGSSTDPMLIAYSQRDLQKNIPEISAHMFLMGFKPNWEVFNLMPASPSINFFQSVWMPLTIGGGTFFSCGEEVTPISTQINLANKITFEVFIGTPSYVTYWLTKAIEELNKGYINSISSIKKCILAGEPLTDEYKKQIKGLFETLGSQPELIENYANNRTKVSFVECQEGAGIHLNPRYFFWEVLDQKTNQVVEEGKSGYLCFSHIDWRGTTFLRYNTGDLIQGLEWKKCEKCGLIMPIIKGPIVRAQDEFIKIKRKSISKTSLNDCIRSTKGVNLYQIIISSNKIDIFVNISEDQKESSTKEIFGKITALTGISPTVVLESKEEINTRIFSRGILKAELIIEK